MYGNSTKQIAEIHIKNQNAEELLRDRAGLLERLEEAIRKALKDETAYIYNIKPAVTVSSEKTRYLPDQKFGFVYFPDHSFNQRFKNCCWEFLKWVQTQNLQRFFTELSGESDG